MQAALDQLNQLINKGWEFPEAVYRVSESFQIPYLDIEAAYDNQFK